MADPRRLRVPALLLAITAGACATGGRTGHGQTAAVDGPRRVILFIADGAGVTHWSAGHLVARERGDSLALEAFPVVGLVDPGNTSRYMPESASGASALATGVRTYYEGVAVGPDSLPRRTVLEAAEAVGRATGVITTTLLVDATPAAFLAHAVHRRNAEAIARQIAASGADVLMGDGRRWFDGSLGGSYPSLLAGMAQRYTVVSTAAELGALDLDDVEALLGFFPIDAGRDPKARRPSLAEMTGVALRILDRDRDGFFLLVENEHTDHSTHENRPLEVVAGEILALDDAVRVALEYQRDHPETLIVVAADHETGGFSLIPRADGVEARYSNTDHTAALVPVFAVGPGAERFGGLHRNDEIGRLLFDAVGVPHDPRPARSGGPGHRP